MPKLKVNKTQVISNNLYELQLFCIYKHHVTVLGKILKILDQQRQDN